MNTAERGEGCFHRLTLTYGDAPATLTVSVLPEGALQAVVTWSSSNDAVATVNGDGLVTPVSAGETTITATAVSGGFADGTDVTVNRKELTIGGTFNVSSKDYDGDANAAINSNSLTLTGFITGDAGSVALNAVAAFSDANAGEDKDVSLTGSTLTGAKAGNYTLSLAGAPTATASIIAKELTIGETFTVLSKDYDGNANAAINSNNLTLTGVVDGDAGSVALNAVAAFPDANVGEDKDVSLTGSALTGAKAGNYTLSLAGAPTARANIIAKELTVGGSFTAQQKTYDGNANATIDANELTLPGVVDGDTGSVSLSAVAVFSDANAGEDKTVSLTGSTLTGAKAGNYTLSLAGAPTATVSIIAKELTVEGSFTAQQKTYDGNANATINSNSLTLTGFITGDADSVALNAVAAFSDANAGADKDVSLTGSTLTGTKAGNYTLSLTGAPTATTNIIAKELIIGGSFTAQQKTYDGNANATIDANELTLPGVVDGDAGSVALNAVAAFSDANVGEDKDVSLTGSTLTGAKAGNYTLSLVGAPTVRANIIAKELTVGGSFTAQQKTYDGNANATIDAVELTLPGVVDGDAGSVSLSAVAVFSDANAGEDKTVSLTGSTLTGAKAGNYTLSLAGAPTATVSIIAKELTVEGSFTVQQKTYDGNANATINSNSLTLTGFITGDADSVALNAVAAFSDANAGEGKDVSLTGSTLTGAKAGNYTLSLTGAPTATANIIAKELTVEGSFTAQQKTYDGNSNSAINSNSLTLTGVVDGDAGSVALNAVAAFPDANVGEDKDVSLTGSTLTGAKASNYTLSLAGAPTVRANIIAKELTVGGSFTAKQKTYDGNANATIDANELTLPGVVDGDAGSVSLSAVAVFSDANAADDKTVSLTGSTLTGDKAGNYTLSLTGAPMTAANIAAKELTVTATAKRKVEGAADPALTYTITSGSLVGADQITGALIREAGEAPGSYGILQGSLSAGGNYQITFVPGAFTIREEPQYDPGTAATPQVTVQDGQAQLRLTGTTVTGPSGAVTGWRYDTPNTLPQQIGAALAQGATNFTLYLDDTEQLDVTVPRFVTVPADVLAAVAGGELSFTVSTAAGSLTLPPALVAALAAQGQPLSLTLYRTGLDTVGNLPVGANATGQPLAVETDLRGATQVNLPLNLQLPENPDERTAFLNSLSVFAVYSDGERVLISNLHFDIDDSVTPAVLTGLSFEAERFGLFTLVRFAYQPLITEVGVPGYAIAGFECALPACYYQGSDTMMPLRMLERYGVVLDWDVASKTVTITYRGHVIVLRLGSDHAEIDGKLVPIVGASGKPLQPNLVNGRVMLPLRFVSEALGFKVNWSPSHIITVKP